MLGMAVWKDLPEHILFIIAQCFTVIDDFASFSAISKECQFVTTILKKKASLPPRYPWLMLAENKNDSIRGFVNLLTSKTFGVELPEARGNHCVGAVDGWLFTLGRDLQINLLHPFSRQQICLPPMLTFPNQYEYDEEFPPQEVLHMFVRKIAMSASPLKGNNLNDECIIVAIYGEFGILAFARLRDTVWTNIKVPGNIYRDVIYYKGKFYAVDVHGVVVVCDIDDNNFPKATVVTRKFDIDDEHQKYLVESSGDLFLVYRKNVSRPLEVKDGTEEDSHKCDEEADGDNNDNAEAWKYICYTVGFSVWKLDESRDEGSNYIYKFTEVDNLGDRALFLGKNISTSIASTDGIKRDCIYFTDDECEFYYGIPGGGGRDTGIFNMKDGTIQFAYAGESRNPISPPIWYI